jgi:hypothetical protein
MKTREEIAQELADKKKSESLSKEILEVKSLFKTFLSDFKASNIKLEHSYSLKDEVSLKQLNNAINSIPKEFKINHTTDKVSNKFLWWYFAVSTLFLSLAIGYGINQHYKYSDIEKVKENAFIQGQKKGYQDIYQIVPKNTQQFLQKKHPNIFKN